MSRGISLSDLGGMPQDMTLEDARSMAATLGRLGQGLFGRDRLAADAATMPADWANRFAPPQPPPQSDPGIAGRDMLQNWLGGAPSLGHEDIGIARRPGWVDRSMDTTGGSFSYFPQTTTPASDTYRRYAGNEFPLELWLRGLGLDQPQFQSQNLPMMYAPLPPRRPR